jgi:hypothetical protein
MSRGHLLLRLPPQSVAGLPGEAPFSTNRPVCETRSAHRLYVRGNSDSSSLSLGFRCLHHSFRKKCKSNTACQDEVRACCDCLLTCLNSGVECHAAVHACRDIASRRLCEACLAKTKGWESLATCYFAIIDACDSYCHQRCSLPQMLEMCAQKNARCDALLKLERSFLGPLRTSHQKR